MPKSKLEKVTCPDCGVEPGEIHHWGCDVERCPFCGFQMLGCSGECRRGKYIIDEDGDQEVLDIDEARIPWSGIWPGIVECQKYGMYSKFDNGWIVCSEDDPEGGEDLNNLYIYGKWDRELKQFVVTPEALLRYKRKYGLL